MVPIFSLVVLAVVLVAGMFVVKSAGGLGLFLKNKAQDEAINKIVERVDDMERQIGIVLDLALESDLIKADDFSKRLLQSQYDK